MKRFKLLSKPKPEREFRYHIDALKPGRFRGWAWMPIDPQHACTFKFMCQDEVIASGRANIFRDDLLAAGIGTGCYGFDLDPGLPFLSRYPKELDFFLDEVKVNRSPILLEADHDRMLQEYAVAMERRVDALLALHRDRVDRELELIRKALKEKG